MTQKKPRRLALAGQKGGAGKSTVAYGLACIALARGKRVLVVDADPRGAWPADAPVVTLGTRRLAPGDVCEDDLSSLGASLAAVLRASVRAGLGTCVRAAVRRGG